jgi:hypothetical protein
MVGTTKLTEHNLTDASFAEELDPAVCRTLLMSSRIGRLALSALEEHRNEKSR